MARIQLFVLLLGALLSLAAASSPQTFCKCTCFKNSTIIPISENPENTPRSLFPPSSFSSLSSRDLPSSPDLADTPDLARRGLEKRVPAACSACTKTFCRSHNLPFCHDATDEDVTTSCFQRDSSTDRLIVWGFILGVLGLLGWAAFQRVREARGGGGIGLGLGGGGGGGIRGLFSRGGGRGADGGGGGQYSPLGQSG